MNPSSDGFDPHNLELAMKAGFLIAFLFWSFFWFGGIAFPDFAGGLLWFILFVIPVLVIAALVGLYVYSVVNRKHSLLRITSRRRAVIWLNNAVAKPIGIIVAAVIVTIAAMLVFSLGHWGWETGRNFDAPVGGERAPCSNVLLSLPFGDDTCYGIGNA